MKHRRNIRQIVSEGLIVLSLLILLASMLVSRGPVDTERAADRMEQSIGRRLAQLEEYVRQSFEAEPDRLLSFRKFPDDMVIYRYFDDTLQSWCNQFPLPNDDIANKIVYQRFINYRNSIVSPLAEVDGELSFVNYGPKWYLVRAFQEGNCHIISGLEIKDEFPDGSQNGINPRLHAGDRYSVCEINGGTGSPVILYGKPLFLIASESVGTAGQSASVPVWVALALFLIASLLYLSCRRTLSCFLLVTAMIIGLMCGAYFYGMHLQTSVRLFSPILYAGSSVLYSLGAVILINLLILMVVLCIYTVRRTLLRIILRKHARLRMSVAALLSVVAVAAVCVYIHMTFKSIVMNSGISLELYKIETLSVFSAVVYLSYFSLAMTVPLLFRMLSPAFRMLSGLRCNAFRGAGKLVFAVACAIYFITASSVLGFRKEQSRVDVWSNRLSMDRNLSLEIQLRSVEVGVATDPVIASLSVLDNSHNIIQNRLAEVYMGKIAQTNDISVYILSEANVNAALNSLFNERISSGVCISDNSHFFYSRDVSGRARYSGLFSYYSPVYGVSNIMVCVEPKSNREDRGYLSLLGISEPGGVLMPLNYSYARYVSDKLVSFKGDYAYPILLSGNIKRMLASESDGHLSMDGYLHFVHYVSGDECIVISRARTDLLSYVVEAVLFALAAYYMLTLTVMRRRRKRQERQYYKSSINAVLIVALVVTLMSMAAFSVYFVYRRNDADMKTMMASKINSIQTMLQAQCRMAESYEELITQDMSSVIEEIGLTLKSDVTLYTPSGKAFMTSTPEIFERMIIGQRINEEALDNIRNGHRRYFIHRERISSHPFYSLYAPILNNEGTMVAIVSSPYTDLSQNLEREALMHVITIITAFILLLIVARILTSAVVNRLFRPISEMSRKMNSADINNLETIDYEQDDEISTLVRAYNLMVHDLSDSTRRLAQVERDKAWSEMARQVAHEIKNPLTPIKLQLQMLIRMKQSGNPAWEEKFDEVAGVVLEHIDILADTANEFSTFARLYSEEPVTIDIDALLRDEVMMFEGNGGIDFSYIGLSGAVITGPKPQLTRVFVNLITNSVQAIQDQQEEDIAAGREPVRGKVAVSLRNSVQDGYYDIVFEDNGPGVKEENRDKLFTPNFTTKSRGTGLGLAICRNIIERCKGDIAYSKSFALEGACFTIRYPKPSK